MKKRIFVLFLLCLSVCACGSRNNNDSGLFLQQEEIHEKTPYELWLEAGNTGSYQDYLDSLVNPQQELINKTFTHYQNEYVNYIDFQEQDVLWPTHGGYALYTYKQHNIDEYNHIDANVTKSEKELNLGGYGVELKQGIFTNYQTDESLRVSSNYYFKNDNDYILNTNTNPYGYVVDNGTVFSGGTMAYVISALETGGPSAQTAEFIKGDATLVYNIVGYEARPELTVNFDNYYTINLKGNPNIGDFVTISGENNTGNSQYDITPGEYHRHYSGYNNSNVQQSFAKQGNTEEAFGTYNFEINSTYKFNNSEYLHNANGVKVIGAFGVTKQ